MLKVYVRTFDDSRAYFSTVAVAAPKTTGPRELVGVPTCASIITSKMESATIPVP